MVTSAELREQARLLELQEQKAYWDKQLADAKAAYEGKCKSSASFTRKVNFSRFPSKSVQIEKVHEVRLREKPAPENGFELEYVTSTIWITSTGKDGGSFSFQLNERRVSHEPFAGWYFMKYDLDPELFDHIFAQAKAAIAFVTEDLGKDLPIKEMIAQGDHNVMSKHVAQLESVGAPTITVSAKEQSILSLIDYVLLHGDLVLNIPGAATIVRNEITKLRENARQWGLKVAERDNNYADQLEAFLVNHPDLKS